MLIMWVDAKIVKWQYKWLIPINDLAIVITVYIINMILLLKVVVIKYLGMCVSLMMDHTTRGI